MTCHKTLIILLLICSFNLFANVKDHFKPCPNKGNYHNIKNIDFIYLINLDKRPDRYQDCCKRLNPYGIYPYRFSAVNGWELSIDDINDIGLKYERWMKSGIMGTYYFLDEKGEIQYDHEIIHDSNKTYFGHCVARGPMGIALSHLSILQDAYDSGYETIWVLEDDIEVIRNPNCMPELIEKLDALVGKEGWDVLFTDKDMKKPNGEYNPCYWHAPRPNFTPWNPHIFAQRTNISPDFQKIGARWGAHSMIVRRSGIEKILNFFKVYKIFLPYDMDFIFPSDIHSDIQLYTVLDDVIAHQIDSVSDNGGPSYEIEDASHINSMH
jgi:GR25 family glycosyltransferase involved in LPS biosynthesis